MPGAGTKTDITTSKPEGLWMRLRRAYKARWWRRQLIWRAFRKRRELTVLKDRTDQIAPGDVLVFSTMRNEAQRLPYFLEHHRKLGVAHFLIVDNDSDDGTTQMLRDQPDVSVWHTAHSYKESRFGVDWLNWLQTRFGTGHWCLVVDADELFIYPHHDQQDLSTLTSWLDRRGAHRMRALMLELYPKGPLNAQAYTAGQDPTEILNYFDSGGFVPLYQPGLHNEVATGGPRLRMFFRDEPRKAPTLSKIPLIKWHWRYAFVSSTHSVLPRALNYPPDTAQNDPVSGVLLHTKFLPQIVDRSREEKQRQEHFAYSAQYEEYYDKLIENPDFWLETSHQFQDWHQLVDLGFMHGENSPESAAC